METNERNNLIASRSRSLSNAEDDDFNNIEVDPDEDPILTATITFDVTVDPSGQVISTSEGQIISESFQNAIDGVSLADHQLLSRNLIESRRDPYDEPMSPNQRISRFNDDDLDDEDASDNDSVSTSTESLIERSKKYMNEEAGIIILKRDNATNSANKANGSKNFNINLDFDLKNDNKNLATRPVDGEPSSSKNFNINLDFDLKNGQINEESSPRFNNNTSKIDDKAFNINLDFDLKNNRTSTAVPSGRKTGVDIDLMITRGTTSEKNETFDERIEEVYEEEYTIENNSPFLKTRSSNLNHQPVNKNVSNENELVNECQNNIRNQNARYEFIERLVEKAAQRSSINQQNDYYRKQLPKVQNFCVENCIKQYLSNLGDQTVPVLRSFETLDIEALTKGFEKEEISEEGKLVLYITQNQLMQLLNQRAIVVPNKDEILKSNELREHKTLSLIDETIGDKLGRESPLKEVELIIDQSNYRAIHSISTVKDSNFDFDVDEEEEVERSQDMSMIIMGDQRVYKQELIDENGKTLTRLSQVDSIESQHYTRQPQDKRSDEKFYDSLENSTYQNKSNNDYDKEIKIESEIDNDSGLISQRDLGYAQSESTEGRKGGKRDKYAHDTLSRKSNETFGRDYIERDLYSRKTDDSQTGDNYEQDLDQSDSYFEPKRKQGTKREYDSSKFDYSDGNKRDESSNMNALRKSYEELKEQLNELAQRTTRDKSSQRRKEQLNTLGLPDYIELSNNHKSTKSKLQQNDDKYDNFSHVNVQDKRETRYISNDEEMLTKEFDIKKQSCAHSFGTSYSGLSVYPTDEVEGRLINYKDFDLLLPSENFESYPDKNRSSFNLPKGYEFLEQGLDFTNYTDNDALRELDRFMEAIRSHLNNGRVDWDSLNRTYSSPGQQLKADIMKKFVNGLTNERKESKEEASNDALTKLEDFISRILNNDYTKRSPVKDNFNNRDSLNEVVDLIRNLKDILSNWKRVKLPDEIKQTVFDINGNKIIIKTTKKLPCKVYTTENKNYAKNNISYNYLDEKQDSSTQLYDALNYNSCTDPTCANTSREIDLFNSKCSLNYTLKPFDPVILDTIGKPSVEQLTKYMSIINTGMKNESLIQIHPIMDQTSKIKVENLNCHESRNGFEPIMIDSGKYPEYIEEITKNFGSLCVTDFPVYIQGFDLNFNKEKRKQIMLIKPGNKSTETVTNCKQRQ